MSSNYCDDLLLKINTTSYADFANNLYLISW